MNRTNNSVNYSPSPIIVEATQTPLLSFEEEQHLSRLAQAGCRTSKEQMILANTRLVISISKNYSGYGVPFDDLFQEGVLGLMRAVDKFQPDRGLRFSTYATWWIRQAVSRSLADQGRTIRIPVHQYDKTKRLYKAILLMTQANGGVQPDDEEVADYLGLEVAEVRRTLELARNTISLDEPIDTSGPDCSNLKRFIPDSACPKPEDVAMSNALREALLKQLDTLPFRQAAIIQMRFGLNGQPRQTLEQIGQKFGITRERIRQLEAQALKLLRHPRRSRKLRNFIIDEGA